MFKGFTLIEVLIYTAITAIVGMLMTGILLSVSQVHQRESASTEVTGQLNFVTQTIGRLVRSSSNIEITAGVSTSTIKLRMQNPAKDPTCISLVRGTIKLAEGPGANPNNCTTTTSDLTNARVIVNALNFRKFVQYPGHDTVSYDVQMTYNSQNPKARVQRSLSSGIARVSAATFDSNLLPGASTFEIGQTGSAWSRAYLGDGTVGRPAYTFGNNTGLGFFRAGANILGFSTQGLERMRIDASGNVGIGTTSPEARLDVAGAIRATGNIGQWGRFTVGGISGMFYPVQFRNDAPGTSVSSDLMIYRSEVHANGPWFGTFMFKVSFHPTNWGNFGGQIEKIEYLTGHGSPYNDPVGNIVDGSAGGSGDDVIIWLRGGATYEWKTMDTVGAWTLLNGNPGGTSITDSSRVIRDPITSQSTLIINAKNRFYTNALSLGTAGTLAVDGTGSSYILGNVGIGTTVPGARLDVGVGASQCCAPQIPNISIAQASATNGNMSWLQFHNAGESEAYIRLAGGGTGIRAGQRRLEIGDSQGVLTSLTVTGNIGIGTTGPTERLHVIGNILKTGTVSFVQDYPGDPTKQIVYISLEGPEAGTYIRGTAECKNNESTIIFPDYFYLVTGESGLTAQLTPRVNSIDLYIKELTKEKLIVSCSVDGAFDYLVNGLRKGYENHQVIRQK